VLGPLIDDVGFDAGVVAVATHDTGSAVAAVPFRGPDAAFICAGTWSLVGMEVPDAVIGDASFAANLTNEGGVGGTFRLLRNVTGLWLLHECRRVWSLEGQEHSFEGLVALAKEAPAFACFIDPSDPAFDGPGDVPARVQAYCAHTGQSDPGTPGAIVRCILESLALKHAETVDLLASVTGVAPAPIHVVGGGAHNELLCAWTASAAGVPVLAGPAEATLLGNLLVQAMALGELGSLAEARDVVRASFAPTVYEPEDGWAGARERFAAVSLPGVGVGA
jgi:rhamnulokinase